MRWAKNKYSPAFTIVELLVVIVVIGILAAITVVSYNGITKKASESTLISDLDNNSKKLEMYKVQYNSYPIALDGSKCPSSPKADLNTCLKSSGSNGLFYVPVLDGSSYKLTAVNSSNATLATVSSSSSPAISQTTIIDSYIPIGSGTVYVLYTSLTNPIYFNFNERLVPDVLPSSYSASLGDTYKIKFTSGNLAGNSYRVAYSGTGCWDFTRNCIGIASTDLTNGNPTVGSEFDILRKY